MEDYAKISQSGLQWGTVEHNIWRTGILSPKESCSGDQVATNEFGIRIPGNEVDHLHIEFRVGRGHKDVSGKPAVS